ncbi:hypothetical protein [Bradyrhizobium sp. S69]|uniref:hypothetical protein n=1 Tax=Bradyrhizobium sp. S69 TaxID=1641856 RepID=UPI00131A658B|nr:hypothetical protein [Bradyrhizobium sp. S69]
MAFRRQRPHRNRGVSFGQEIPPDNPKSGEFDFMGTLLNASMFGFGFIGIDLLTRGGNIWIGMGALTIGTAAAARLFFHSRSQAEPIVPFDLLRNPVFSLSVATSIASFAAQMLAFVSLPFFFESALHRGQVESGLMMTPWPLAVGIGAPIAGRLADKVSAAVLGAAGLLVLCGSGSLGRPPREPVLGRDRMAYDPMRTGIRLLPGAEQSLDVVGRAAFAQRGCWGNARHGPPHGPDHRGDSRRHIPGCCTFRDRGTVGGRNAGRGRSGRQRRSALSSRGALPPKAAVVADAP